MKKLLTATLLALLCASVHAGDYTVHTLVVTSVNTNSTARTDTLKGVTGKAVAFAYTSTTSMVVVVASTAGYGLSLDSAKVLVSNTNDTYQSNLATNLFLGNDRVVMSAYSADGEGHTVTGRLLMEE